MVSHQLSGNHGWGLAVPFACSWKSSAVLQVCKRPPCEGQIYKGAKHTFESLREPEASLTWPSSGALLLLWEVCVEAAWLPCLVLRLRCLSKASPCTQKPAFQALPCFTHEEAEVGVTESCEVAGLNFSSPFLWCLSPPCPPPGTFSLKEEWGEGHMSECEDVHLQ